MTADTSTITLNGEPRELAAPTTVADLLAACGYTTGKVAVARNGEFVARSRYAATPVNPGDDIEVVAPMQGG